MNSKIEKMAAVAQSFCTWAERETRGNEFDEAAEARLLLSRLVAAVVEINVGVESGDSSTPERSVTDEEYRRVYESFAALPVGYYSMVFDPLAVPSSDEPLTGDLADDLADIWRDVKRGLSLFEQGETLAAGWAWAFDFSAHWGHHATSALYALQSWFSQKGDDRQWLGV